MESRSTAEALHQAGMLTGIDFQPTEAGHAYFTTPKIKL